MMQVADAPCRLIYIIGMPSGGTTCAARILTMNGFWNSSPNGSEAYEAYDVVTPSFHDYEKYGIYADLCHVTDDDRTRAATVFTDYKRQAIDAGFDKAVMKCPGLPVLVPELFDTPCGVKVEPLLVCRDPDSAARSLVARHPRANQDNRNADAIARIGQARIRYLNLRYGWPMWEFGPDADVSALGAIVGHELDPGEFDAARIMSG